MGNITISFTTESTGQAATYSFHISDVNLARMVTHLRHKYSTLANTPPDPGPITTELATPAVALRKASVEVVSGWKDAVIRWETANEAANVANTIPPIDTTEV